MNAAETLLARLEQVRDRGDDRYSASCPGPLHAHGDRSAGLGIKAVDDRILINCPAGCSALDIVNAVGLELSDLFERRLTDTAIAPMRQPPFPRERCRRIRHLALVISLASGDLKYGRALSEADEATLLGAFSELEDLVTAVETWPRGVAA